jgi:uncharacterized protein YfaA (DUF2138 family)
MRPLYIDGLPGCRVVLDEPALRLEVPDKADQLFTVVMKREGLLRLLESLNALIKTAEDDIRCYRLPERTDIKALGRQFFPKDVMLFTSGINRLLVTSH